MCGICGEVDFGGGTGADPERVRRMASLMVHRGPDGEGLWHEGGVAFGHRRLSIIDLTDAAAQPMATPDGRFVIAFNGEIYNFRELRADLEAKGEVFSSRSDTEVLLRCLALEGLDGLARLNGMWAFALWDRAERKLLLCRDRLGIKPLYWSRVPGGVVFASEIPPLLEHPGVSREINRRALAEQVACRYVLAPRTLFTSVFKLPPGHVLEASDAGVRLSPYWSLPMGDHTRATSEDEAVADFGRLFEASVAGQLVADVPVGVLLSGGVDSSAVAAAVRRAGHRDLLTFTVAFEGAGSFDERAYAEAVARRLGADHSEVVITPSRFAETLDDVFLHLDDPVADAAVLPLYHVCGLASERVKVLLSGQGADELFGGYHLDRVLKQIRAIRLMRSIPGARRLAASIARKDPKRAYLARWDDIRHAEAGHLPGKIRYDLTLPLGRDLMDGLLVDCMNPPYDRTLDAFYADVPSHRGPLDAILSVLTRGWLPDNLLNHSDRMAMAHSVEMRVPFLDHPLTEFAFHLPEDMKIGARETKRVLKAYAAAAGLPRAVAYRRKAGFPVPWSEWIRGPLRIRVEEVLEGASWFEGTFHRDGIRRVMAQHQEGRDHGLLLWNLTVLAHWGQRLVG